MGICGNNKKKLIKTKSDELVDLLFFEKKEFLKRDLKACSILKQNEIKDDFEKFELFISSEEDINNIYSFHNRSIGEGAYGKVKKAKLKLRNVDYEHLKNKPFAIKIINYTKHTVNMNVICGELAVLRSVDHPNIIKFFECYYDETYLYIVMELCTGGDLQKRLDLITNFKEENVKPLFFQMLCAVNSLHSKGICHRDIKPQNFLFGDSSYHKLKLTDFGLSKAFVQNNKLKTVCGSPVFVAPEILNNLYNYTSNYDEKIDNWSLGITLYLLLSGKVPFTGRNNVQVFENIQNDHVKFKSSLWLNVSDNCKEVIMGLLQKDPKKRLTLNQVITHPWLQPIERSIYKDGIDNITKYRLD